MARSKITGTIIYQLFILLLLIVLLALVNFITNYVNSSFLNTLTAFINANFVLLIIISLVFFVGRILYLLKFPVSLFAPPFEAVGAVLVVKFLIAVIGLIDTLGNTRIVSYIEPFRWIIYVIVFILVLIIEYSKIRSRANRSVQRDTIKEVIEEKEIEKDTYPRRKKTTYRKRVRS